MPARINPPAPTVNVIHWWIVSLILTIHIVLLAWIAYVNSPTNDEVAHLPSGLSHWQLRSFDLYRVNPPLMRMIATLPLLIVDPQTDWAILDGPYARPEFQVGVNFVNANGANSLWLFTICRWAQIPVSLLGAWICYLWADELYGKASARISLSLWCFCPNILTWGATVTPDCGAAVFGVAAGYTFWRWLSVSTTKRAIVAGVALGLAELTKATWVILFLLWPIQWLLRAIFARGSTLNCRTTIQIGSILLLAVYIVNIGYAFENTIQPLGQFSFISRALGGENAHVVPGNRFRGTWFAQCPVPLPANYLAGIDVQKADFETPKPSYFRGEHRIGGWYDYYVYGLFVKTPVGTLLLVALSIVFRIWNRDNCTLNLGTISLLTPAITVLVIVSSQTGFNRHIRYVVPSVPFLYIFASRFQLPKVRNHRFWAGAYMCCFTGGIAESVSVLPHAMSFFNVAAGGPSHGASHLLDSNIDWGQDLSGLRRFIQLHPESNNIRLSYCGLINPHLAGINYVSMVDGANMTFKPGWYAISVNHLNEYPPQIYRQFRLARLKALKPTAMAGYSIYIYCLGDEECRALND